MPTYGFADVQASITGPGGSFDLGYGSGASEEGVTIAFNEDKNKMDIGADGTPQHSLHAGNGGTITFHLLKVSTHNQLMSSLYSIQTTSTAMHGKNVITLKNPVTGDAFTGVLAAFKKFPDNAYSKDANVMNWAFDVGIMSGSLGAGN